MNLQAKDLLDSTQGLLERLKDTELKIDIGSFLKQIKLPSLDSLSEGLTSLLPKNLTEIDIEGVVMSLNPLNLQDTIKKGINSVQGLIEDEIKGVISEVTSTVEQATNTINSTINTVKGVGDALSTNQFDLLTKATEALASITDFDVDVSAISQFQNSISKATDTIKDFSPKQIRDLADPDIYEKVVQETLQTANSLLETEALSQLNEFIKIPTSIGAATSMFSAANSLLGSSGPKGSNTYSLEVSISTYNGKGEGGDLEAYTKKSATGKQLISGKSCAVDNVNILFNSKVDVPGVGVFNAVDKLRGGGATLQLYYESDTEAAAVMPMLKNKLSVKVTPPGGSIPAQVLVAARGIASKLI